jgi:hypothetical protein
MMWNTINRVAATHKGIARAGGFLMGYLAASPLKHPFMALAALASGGEYLRRKREAEAMDAARNAALIVGETDPACRDPKSADCLDHARAAAVNAGTAVLHRGGGMLRKLGAFLFAVVTITTLVHGELVNAAISAGLCVACAWPYLPSIRHD